VRLQVAFALLSIFSKQKYQVQVTVRGDRMGTPKDDKMATHEVQGVKVEQKRKDQVNEAQVNETFG
jgi:hypothetical protein